MYNRTRGNVTLPDTGFLSLSFSRARVDELVSSIGEFTGDALFCTSAARYGQLIKTQIFRDCAKQYMRCAINNDA